MPRSSSKETSGRENINPYFSGIDTSIIRIILSKDLLTSKTFYFNLITIALGVLEVITKTYPIDPSVLALIMGIGNLVLRVISNKPIESIGGLRLK